MFAKTEIKQGKSIMLSEVVLFLCITVSTRTLLDFFQPLPVASSSFSLSSDSSSAAVSVFCGLWLDCGSCECGLVCWGGKWKMYIQDQVSGFPTKAGLLQCKIMRSLAFTSSKTLGLSLVHARRAIYYLFLRIIFFIFVSVFSGALRFLLVLAIFILFLWRIESRTH